MLGAEEGDEFDAVGLGHEIDEVTELSVDRRRVRDQADATPGEPREPLGHEHIKPGPYPRRGSHPTSARRARTIAPLTGSGTAVASTR